MRNVLFLTIGLAILMCGMAMADEPAAAQADPAMPAGPGMFAVVLRHLTDTNMGKEAENAALMAHVGYLNDLFDKGVLYLAGPFMDDSNAGMAIVFAASADEAGALLAADPSVASGLMEVLEIHPWWAAFSAPDNRRFTMADMQAMMADHESTPGDDAGQGDATTETGDSQDQGAMEMTPGGVSFIQIPSGDVAASSTFYSTVFGWQIQADDTGITFYTAPGGMMGEFSTELKPAAPMTGPTFFINCDSVKAKLSEVEAAGGSIYQPEMQLPKEWGWIAIIGDSSGNAVGLWSIGE